MENHIFPINLRGAALFWVSLILAFIVLGNSENGVPPEFWGLVLMAVVGVIHLVYSLHKYGKFLEEKKQRNRDL